MTVILARLVILYGARPIASGGFKLAKASTATDQEGRPPHFYVGSTGLLQKPVSVSGRGRLKRRLRNAIIYKY